MAFGGTSVLYIHSSMVTKSCLRELTLVLPS